MSFAYPASLVWSASARTGATSLPIACDDVVDVLDEIDPDPDLDEDVREDVGDDELIRLDDGSIEIQAHAKPVGLPAVDAEQDDSRPRGRRPEGGQATAAGDDAMRVIHLLWAGARFRLGLVAIRTSRRLATLGEWLLNLRKGSGRKKQKPDSQARSVHAGGPFLLRLFHFATLID
jgi:hypothetical protein